VDNSTDVDVEGLELELCRLADVSSARVVLDPGGHPTEVHVLANPGKPAKQIARDVVSVALASFGLELDRRIVSVVQLGGNGVLSENGAATGVDFRPRVVAIISETAGMRALVRVTLEYQGAEAVGFSEGSVATSARGRLVAAATLDALRQLEPVAECVDVEHALITRVGVHDVAVVAVVFVIPPSEQMISGSAVVRDQNPDDAIARAILDATNRRLPHLA